MIRRWYLHVLAAGLLALAGVMLGCRVWWHRHYRAAEQALARRDGVEAMRHARWCLRLWVWDAETHVLAARAARLAGDYEEAERYLGVGLQLGGEADAIDLEYKFLSAYRGDVHRVEGFLVNAVLRNHPESARILEVLTRAYYANFQLANAQECVKRWLEHEPKEAEAWLWRARVYEKLLNRPETTNSYRRVVELDPANDDARLALASLLATGQQPQEALQNFETLRLRLGDVTPVLAGIARCRRCLDQPDAARALLEQLLAKEPDNALLCAERGRLALEYEPAADAEKWLRRAASLMPFEKDINYSLYQCLERLGKRQEAQEVLARLKRIEADLDRINDLTRNIARAPHNAALRCEAGQILIRNGQGIEGARWLHSALREDPSHAATHAALADYYERAGDRTQAERHRRLAEPGSALVPVASDEPAP